MTALENDATFEKALVVKLTAVEHRQFRQISIDAAASLNIQARRSMNSADLI